MSPERPLAIGIVTGSMSRLAGGLFNSVRRSALALAEAGQRVEVLALQDAHSEEDLAAWGPLKPKVANRVGPAGIGYAPEIARFLREGDFDLVHQHGIWQGFSAQVSAWRRRSGKPVMISPRGMLDPWALANSGWKKRLTGALWEKANLANAACLHALNASEAASMRGFGLANPVAMIPNGADLPPEGEVAPPSWWPGGKVLLFIGRIHPKKGISELVRAFASFATSAEGSDWHCVIAGWDDGGHLGGLQGEVAREGMEGRILLPGPVFGAEKHAALQHATAFVLPSFSEGLPMSVLEAWAHRLPVLMTAECNLPEGFAEGAAVEITTDPAAMAAAFAANLGAGDASALAAMGGRGRQLVEKRYSWQQIASDHIQVYRWMCGQAADMPACVETGGGAA